MKIKKNFFPDTNLLNITDIFRRSTNLKKFYLFILAKKIFFFSLFFSFFNENLLDLHSQRRRQAYRRRPCKRRQHRRGSWRFDRRWVATSLWRRPCCLVFVCTAQCSSCPACRSSCRRRTPRRRRYTYCHRHMDTWPASARNRSAAPLRPRRHYVFSPRSARKQSLVCVQRLCPKYKSTASSQRSRSSSSSLHILLSCSFGQRSA